VPKLSEQKTGFHTHGLTGLSVVVNERKERKVDVSSMMSSDPSSSDESFRRRSILGPPSLFPSQKTSEAGGDAGEVEPEPSSQSQSGSKQEQQLSEEISLAIADLDFYYGLGK
jgi:hypothetical protein